MNSTDLSNTTQFDRNAPKTEASTAPPREFIEAYGFTRLLASFVFNALLAAEASAPAFTGQIYRRRDEFPDASSTASVSVDPALVRSVKQIFEEGASEFFEDGKANRFSRTLGDLLELRGMDALSAIAEFIFSDQGDPEAVAEALRWMADFGGPETLPKKWAILRHGLRSNSPTVRDGAILGFAALDDPRSTALLEEAGRVEQIQALQRLIDRVRERLLRHR